MPYEFHEDISIADVAFSVEAATQEELLVDGALATFEVMASLKKVEPKVRRDIKLEEESFEKLYFAWIEELIYLKDAEYMLFSKFSIKVSRGQKYVLEAEAWGEPIQPDKHETNVDVKAITYHRFRVWEEAGKWKAFVILDI